MEMMCADCQQASTVVRLCVEAAMCLAIGAAAWTVLNRRKNAGPGADPPNWALLLPFGGILSWRFRGHGQQLSDCFFDNGCLGLGWATGVFYFVSTAVAVVCFWCTWLMVSDGLVERLVARIKRDRE